MILISVIMAGITNSKYELSSFIMDVDISVFDGLVEYSAKKTQLYKKNQKCNKNNPLMHLETPRSEFQGFYRAEAKISMELEVLNNDKKIQPGNFKVSETGLELITPEEGFVSYMYSDLSKTKPPQPWSKYPKGKPTIGYGQVVDPTSYPKGISKSDTATLLHNHLGTKVLPYMNSRITVPLTQNQIDATASYVYNVGVGNAFGPPTRRFLTNLNNGNFRAAALEMDIISSGGSTSGVFGLIGRRQKEQQLFLKP